MTDMLSTIGDRIAGIRQLGSVVNAMTGIAAARARTAQDQIEAVENYSAIIRTVIKQASAGLTLNPEHPQRQVLLVFCAEQGFVGGFSERVLGRLASEHAGADIFLIGTRGTEIARGQGIEPVWNGAMPSRSASIPRFADNLAHAVLSQDLGDGISAVDALFMVWRKGSAAVERHRLYPADLSSVQQSSAAAPLTNLPLQELLPAFEADHFHAQICVAALNSFAAENEVRMATMSAAQVQIERELATLEATQRRIRQEAITTEIIEIVAGDLASRSRQPDR